MKIIIIRGALGVGKTTISKLLATKINAKYISLDQVLKENNLEGTDGIPVENFLKANEILVDIIKKDKTNIPFIIDGCFYYQDQIDDLQQKFGNKVTIFSLLSDVETCIQRDGEREKVYGEDSARFVYMMTEKVKIGHEIDNSNLTVNETLNKIYINK